MTWRERKQEWGEETKLRCNVCHHGYILKLICITKEVTVQWGGNHATILCEGNIYNSFPSVIYCNTTAFRATSTDTCNRSNNKKVIMHFCYSLMVSLGWFKSGFHSAFLSLFCLNRYSKESEGENNGFYRNEVEPRPEKDLVFIQNIHFITPWPFCTVSTWVFCVQINKSLNCIKLCRVFCLLLYYLPFCQTVL